MWLVWERIEMHTKFWYEILGVNKRIIIKYNLKTGWERVEWINVAQDSH
jgi:hypothetical protein